MFWWLQSGWHPWEQHSLLGSVTTSEPPHNLSNFAAETFIEEHPTNWNFTSRPKIPLEPLTLSCVPCFTTWEHARNLPLDFRNFVAKLGTFLRTQRFDLGLSWEPGDSSWEFHFAGNICKNLWAATWPVTSQGAVDQKPFPSRSSFFGSIDRVRIGCKQSKSLEPWSSDGYNTSKNLPAAWRFRPTSLLLDLETYEGFPK